MLEGPDGPVTKTKNMLALAGDFYKNVFGFEEMLGLKLDDSFWEDNDKITSLENEMLEAPFSESEIKEASLILMLMGPLAPTVFPSFFTNIFGT